MLPNTDSFNGVVYCTTNLLNSKKYIGQDSRNNPSYLGSGKMKNV